MSEPVAQDALTEVTNLLDDLARLLDVTAANAEPDHRRRAVDTAGRIRQLRVRLTTTDHLPSTSTPGPWYGDLAAALGDTHALPAAALTDRIDQLEHVLDRAFSRRRRRWWRADKR
jgi:hypothetical protein